MSKNAKINRFTASQDEANVVSLDHLVGAGK
jgi:hypothetical protein